MRQQCDCGRVRLNVDSHQCIVHCTKCDWRHTYKAVPKRLIQALEQLLAWFKSRGVEAPSSKGVEIDNEEKD